MSKAQIKKKIMSGGALGSILVRLICPLTKTIAPLAKNILIPLGLKPAMSGIDSAIQKKYMDQAQL